MVLSRRLRAWMSRVLAAAILTAGVAGTLSAAHSHHMPDADAAAHAVPSAMPCHTSSDTNAPAPIDCQTLCDSASLADAVAAPHVKSPSIGIGPVPAAVVASQHGVIGRGTSLGRPPDRWVSAPWPDLLLITSRRLI